MFQQMPAVRRCRAKTAFLLPLAGALMLAFPGMGAGPPLTGGKPASSGLVAPLKMPLPTQDRAYDVGEYNTKEPGDLPKDYLAFLKRNPTVGKVIWFWEQELPLKVVQVMIILRSGVQESYNWSSETEMARAVRKYGKLPWPAPPVAKYDVPPPIPARPEKPLRPDSL
jgi:hypothetical protein